jgi:hypothetical protein
MKQITEISTQNRLAVTRWLPGALLALFMMPVNAHASMFKGEALDKGRRMSGSDR